MGTPVAGGATGGGNVIVLAPNGRTGYITNDLAGQVTPIDLRTGRLRKPIHVGTRPHAPGGACPARASSCPYGLALAPDGTKLFVTDRDSQQLSIVDLAHGNRVTNLKLAAGRLGQGIAVNPDGSLVYVADGRKVVVVRAATKRVIRTIAVTFPDDLANGVIWPLALTPDGRTVYVGDGYFGGGGGPFGDQVVAIPINGAVPAGPSTTIQTGFEPWGIAFTSDPTAQVRPVLGRSVAAATVSGRVLVQLPHGRGFEVLTKGRSVPVGSTVDATAGVVRITSAKAVPGRVQSALFYSGQFRVTQARSGLTNLRLNATLECPGGLKRGVIARHRPRRRRRLWGNGSGNFGTSGLYAAGTVQGTKWLTEDTCTGTRITVARGVVAVRDLICHVTVLVPAGHSYLAGH